MTATGAGTRPVSPAPQDGPVQAPGPGVPARGPPGGGHGHEREFIVRHGRGCGRDTRSRRHPARPPTARAGHGAHRA